MNRGFEGARVRITHSKQQEREEEETMFELVTKSRIWLLQVAVAASLIWAPAAFAIGTSADTDIDNTATISYSVAGSTQTPIESSPTGNSVAGPGNGEATTFKVDNVIDFSVTEADTAYTPVAPGSTFQALGFTVQNDGNEVQDFSFTAAEVSTGGDDGHSGTDDFDGTAVGIFVESGATPGYQQAEDTATYVDELDENLSATVWVVRNIGDDRQQAYILIDYLYRKLGYEKVGVIRSSNRYGRFGVREVLDGSRRLKRPVPIEMAYDLARTLSVRLEFVPIQRERLEDQVNAGDCDILMSGLAVTPDRAAQMDLSVSYRDETLAFVVPSHRRKDFSMRAALGERKGLRLGILRDPYYAAQLRVALPNAEAVELSMPREFFEGNEADLDAFLFTAEAGSAWTLLHPRYAVVVPQPGLSSIPLAYAVPRGEKELVDYVNAWIELKLKDGTTTRLYDYWILGRGAVEKKPRWSVIRNVLHWIE